MSDVDGSVREDAAGTPDRKKIEAMRRFIRTEGKRYLDDPNITSIGTGYKVTDGKTTGELSVQFTVRTKLGDDDRPEALGTKRVPKVFDIEGEQVPTDVIQRDYSPSYRGVVAEETDVRKLRRDPMVPGISIGHISSSAGTLGMIVFDRETGGACALSNWHVLHGAGGNIGDDIVQPGTYDDNNTDQNVCGQLLRSHLGEAGDCAVASISHREYDDDIWELSVAPTEIVRVDLGDLVIKSGRTTGVTKGVVRRVDVIVDMKYDDRSEKIGGFEIGAPSGSPPDFEVSMGGDSGAAWLIAKSDGSASNKLAGLHFAGESGTSSDEHALACYAHSVFKKLGIGLAAEQPELLATAGYDPSFLGTPIPIPKLAAAVKADAVKLDGKPLIPYTHFSVCMSKKQGFARFVAWNVDGSRLKAISRTGIPFELDDRIKPDHQHGEELYSDNKLDRGHIARRADLCWGSLSEAKRANEDSFYFTNITPQHQAFNQSRRRGLWGLLENAIFEDVDVSNLRIAVFGGPIFRDDDVEYRGVQIPRDFWKLLAYHDASDGKTKVRAYMLTQRALLDDLEVLDLDPFQLYQIPLERVREETGLDFGAVAEYDTFSRVDEPEGMGASTAAARPINSVEDILG